MKQARPMTSILALALAATLATGCVVKKEESGTSEFDINLAATGQGLIGLLGDVSTNAGTTFSSKAVSAISQRQTHTTISGQCEINQGTVTLDANDADNNHVMSIGDTFKVTFNQCVIKGGAGLETLNGEINATATAVDSTTHEVTAADIHLNLTNVGLAFTADLTYQLLQQASFRIELKPGTVANVGLGSRVFPVTAFTSAYGVPRLTGSIPGYQIQISLTATDPMYGTLAVALDSLTQLNGGTSQTDVTANGSTVRITSAGNGNVTLRGTSGEQTVNAQVLIDAIKNR